MSIQLLFDVLGQFVEARVILKPIAVRQKQTDGFGFFNEIWFGVTVKNPVASPGVPQPVVDPNGLRRFKPTTVFDSKSHGGVIPRHVSEAKIKQPAVENYKINSVNFVSSNVNPHKSFKLNLTV